MSLHNRLIVSVVGSTLLMLFWLCLHQAHQLQEADRQARILRDQRGMALAFAQNETARLRAQLENQRR